MWGKGKRVHNFLTVVFIIIFLTIKFIYSDKNLLLLSISASTMTLVVGTDSEWPGNKSKCTNKTLNKILILNAVGMNRLFKSHTDSQEEVRHFPPALLIYLSFSPSW